MTPEKIPELLETISQVYYEEVPLKYKTYCILTSQITQDVLRYFDVPSYLIPCQLWCAIDTQNYVVGFSGSPVNKQRWDGHVVCGTDCFIIDAAVSHFAEEFSLNAPHIVVTRRFSISSHNIARVDLIDDQHLWWQDAPAGVERYPKLEDMKLVKELAHQLIHRIENRLNGH